MGYLDNASYHVYNRGAHRQSFFKTSFELELCLKIFERFADKYHVQLRAYCLMPNHYHLLLHQLQGGSISSFLRTSFSAYTQSFNAREHHSGTIFQGSPKSKLIESDEQMQTTILYIHYNPVASNLVNKPQDWIYSDFSCWAGLIPFRFHRSGLRDELFEGRKGFIKAAAEYPSTAPKLVELGLDE